MWSVCVSHLGIYEVSADHGHQGLHVLRHVITGQGEAASRNFCTSHSHDFVTRWLPAHRKKGKGQKRCYFSPCIITVVLLSVHQNSRGSYSLPGSSFADEDQGTHDDAGQGDAHTGNDPSHRLLVYVVETIWKHWRIGRRKKKGVWQESMEMVAGCCWTEQQPSSVVHWTFVQCFTKSHSLWIHADINDSHQTQTQTQILNLNSAFEEGFLSLIGTLQHHYP